MEFIKSTLESLISWFKHLTKQQQLLTVGIIIIIAIFSGRGLLRNDLDGKYFGNEDGVSVTVVIHGKTGDLIAEEGDETHKARMTNIDVNSQTFTLEDSESDRTMEMTFKKEGDSLRIPELNDELILIKD
ncbi:TPA: hypothetical protein ACGO59_001396 [Streptococcus suis]|nr:hypothetical protein [Streptococcus suis]